MHSRCDQEKGVDTLVKLELIRIELIKIELIKIELANRERKDL